MKRHIVRLLTGLTSASVLLSPISAAAYEREDYDTGVEDTNGNGTPDEGDREYWYINGNTNPKDNIASTLYFYIQKENATWNNEKIYYVFDVFTDIPEDYQVVHLCYDFIPAMTDVVESLEYGDVVRFDLPLEMDQDYCFSAPDAIDNNNVRVLTSQFTSPMIGEGFYEEGDIESGRRDVIHIAEHSAPRVVYAYGGEKSWMNDPAVLEEYITWAKSNYGERNAAIQASDDYQVQSTDTPEFIDALAVSTGVETAEEPTPTVEFTPAEGPVRQTSSEVTVEEPEPVEKKMNYTPIIVGVLAAVIGAGCFIYIKKKNSYY